MERSKGIVDVLPILSTERPKSAHKSSIRSGDQQCQECDSANLLPQIVSSFQIIPCKLMKDKIMTQYLLQIKAKDNSFAAAGAPLDVEDVIHYTLNGLPSNYQALKTAIHVNLQPLMVVEGDNPTTIEDGRTFLIGSRLTLIHSIVTENRQDLLLRAKFVTKLATLRSNVGIGITTHSGILLNNTIHNNPLRHSF